MLVVDAAFSTSTRGDEKNVWYIDSGATRHMTCNAEFLHEPKSVTPTIPVRLGDNHVVGGSVVGSVRMALSVEGKKIQSIFSDVLLVPELQKNLFSVSAAADKGVETVFRLNDCVLMRSGAVVGTGTRIGNLYCLNFIPVSSESVSVASAAQDMHTWHRRLCHASETRVRQLADGMATGITVAAGGQSIFCEPCVRGKMHRTAISSQPAGRAKEKLELVHSDVCGPMSCSSFGGARYFVSFIDDLTRKTEIFFIKEKSQALPSYKEFEARATNQCGKKIRQLRSDRGGEYVSKQFKAHLAGRGTENQFTAPYTPEQNGVAERKNRTLVEMARCILQEASLTHFLGRGHLLC